MANNRMYLRCTECGSTLYLTKHFGGEWDWNFSEEKLKEINDFFFEHFYEHENKPYHIENHQKHEGIDKSLDTKFRRKFGHKGSNFDLCYEFDNGDEQ